MKVNGAVGAFLLGMASIFDFSGSLAQYAYPYTNDADADNARAMASDWKIIGDDMSAVFDAELAESNRSHSIGAGRQCSRM